jgi:dolichyl-phosphate beta-glucosyltransferase
MSTTAAEPELSIVIPAFNEEARLPRALARIRDYLAARGLSGGQAEIIVVDDGSSDGTARVTEEWSRQLPSIRLVSNGENRGKGFSVRHGMLEARGRIALFTDADLSAPIAEADKLFAALKAGNDVAIGSRALDRSLIFTHQSRLREIAGIIFNGFVRIFTGLPFHDTQCGFKAFVREPCRVVFEQQRIERFGFDPEVLFLAKRRGLRAVEIPVRWAHDPATKVHVLRDSVLMFTDLVRIRWNWALGRYPARAPRNFPR